MMMQFALDAPFSCPRRPVDGVFCAASRAKQGKATRDVNSDGGMTPNLTSRCADWIKNLLANHDQVIIMETPPRSLLRFGILIG
jgi:hypothetical protein